MASKTLLQMKTSVARRYGDTDYVSCTQAEIEEYLQDGFKRVAQRCPWIVPDDQILTTTIGGYGQISVGEPNIGRIMSLSVYRNGQYERLPQINLGDALKDETATSIEYLYGYSLEGPYIYLAPILPLGTSITIQINYQNSAGNAGFVFPIGDGSSFPATIPDAVEDAIIRFALAELYARDNDYEAANFALNDFAARVQELQAIKSRPEAGQSITPRQTDYYLLDVEYAW